MVFSEGVQEVLVVASIVVVVVVCFSVQGLLFFKVKSRFREFAEKFRRQKQNPRCALLSYIEINKLLDQQLLGCLQYDLLKRVSIGAPLIGVVLTGCTVMFKGNGPLNGDGGFTASELYVGVVAGAVVAIINQLLLFWVHKDWQEFRGTLDDDHEANEVSNAAVEFSTGLRKLLQQTTVQSQQIISEVSRDIGAGTRRTMEALEQAIALQAKVADQVGVQFSTAIDRAIAESVRVGGEKVQWMQDLLNENTSKVLQGLMAARELQERVSCTLESGHHIGETVVRLTERLAVVSDVLEGTLRTMSEKSAPQAERSLDQFSVIVANLTSQVGSSFEVVSKSSHQFAGFLKSVSDLGESLGKAAGRMTESAAAFEDMVDSRTEVSTSLLELQELQVEVAESLRRSKEVGGAIVSLTSELGRLTSFVGGGLQQFVSTDFEHMSSQVRSFTTQVAGLSDQFAQTRTVIEGSSGGLRALISQLEFGGESLVQAAVGVEESASQWKVSIGGAGLAIEGAAGLLRETISREVIQGVQGFSRELADVMASASGVAESVPVVLQSLRDQLNAVGSHLGGLGGVSAQVGEAVLGMERAVLSLRSELETQGEALRHWRSVLDAVPKSLQAETDGVVKELVAHLAEITAYVGSLSKA